MPSPKKKPRGFSQRGGKPKPPQIRKTRENVKNLEEEKETLEKGRGLIKESEKKRFKKYPTKSP